MSHVAVHTNEAGEEYCSLLMPMAGKQSKHGKDKDKHKHKHGIEKSKDKEKHKEKHHKKNAGSKTDDKETTRLLKKTAKEKQDEIAQLEADLANARETNALLQEMIVEDVKRPDDLVTIVIEDSADNETKHKKHKKDKKDKKRKEEAPKDTKANRTRQSALNEVKMQCEFAEFLRAEALLYVEFGVDGADELLQRAVQQRSAVEAARDYITARKTMKAVELNEIDETMGKINKALKRLTKDFKKKKFGGFSKRLEETEQDKKAAGFTAKKKDPKYRYVAEQLQDLLNKRAKVIRRIYQHEANRSMDVETKVATSTGGGGGRHTLEKDRQWRTDIYNYIKNLLTIANNDKSHTLELYNENLETSEREDAMLDRYAERYGNIKNVPEALRVLLKRVEQYREIIDACWVAREEYVISVVEPKKERKDPIMAPVRPTLALLQTTLDELDDAAMLVEVRALTTVPSDEEVSKNPLKLFTRFDSEVSDNVLLVTCDQRRGVLHEGPIDIAYMKSACLTLGNGLFLARSQFENPQSINGVYTAQDISKNQIITFCEGRVVKDGDLPRDRKMMVMAQFFRGAPTLGLPHWYLLMDEDDKGMPVTGDTVQGLAQDVNGAGGFLHDCLDLELYRQVMSPPQTGGDGSNKKEGESDLTEIESESGDRSEDDSGDDGAIGPHKLRPHATDPELAAESGNKDVVRPCVNCVMEIYDDPYNQSVRDAAFQHGHELCVMLSPKHSVLVIKATRTIRRGEELVVKFPDVVWSNYLRGGHVPQPLGRPELTSVASMPNQSLREAAASLRKSLDIELISQRHHSHPLSKDAPTFDPDYIEPYEPPTTEEEEEEEEEEAVGSMDEEEELEEVGEEEGDDDDDEEEEEEMEALIEGVELDIQKLESRITATDARHPDLVDIRALFHRVETAGDDITDEVYKSMVIELLERARLLFNDATLIYYALEEGLMVRAKNQITQRLDENSDAYKLYQEFYTIRKKIEQLAVSDAINHTTVNEKAIKELERARKEKRGALEKAWKKEQQQQKTGKLGADATDFL